MNIEQWLVRRELDNHLTADQRAMLAAKYFGEQLSERSTRAHESWLNERDLLR
jgi:hypothetical protein